MKLTKLPSVANPTSYPLIGPANEPLFHLLFGCLDIAYCCKSVFSVRSQTLNKSLSFGMRLDENIAVISRAMIVSQLIRNFVSSDETKAALQLHLSLFLRATLVLTTL